MQAHQEPSATAGEDTSITIQTVSTPPAVAIQEKEKSAIQTLVELPKIGTPTKTL